MITLKTVGYVCVYVRARVFVCVYVCVCVYMCEQQLVTPLQPKKKTIMSTLRGEKKFRWPHTD